MASKGSLNKTLGSMAKADTAVQEVQSPKRLEGLAKRKRKGGKSDNLI